MEEKSPREKGTCCCRETAWKAALSKGPDGLLWLPAARRIGVLTVSPPPASQSWGQKEKGIP